MHRGHREVPRRLGRCGQPAAPGHSRVQLSWRATGRLLVPVRDTVGAQRLDLEAATSSSTGCNPVAPCIQAATVHNLGCRFAQMLELEAEGAVQNAEGETVRDFVPRIYLQVRPSPRLKQPFHS